MRGVRVLAASLFGCLCLALPMSATAHAVVYNPAAGAWECAENALVYTGSSFQGKAGGHIHEAGALRFEAWASLVQTSSFDSGPSCDLYGWRTAQVWEVMANDRGKVVRNSPILDVIRQSNAALPYTWFRLRLFHLYTCLPGRASRHWGFVLRVIAHYRGNHRSATSPDDLGQSIFVNYGEDC